MKFRLVENELDPNAEKVIDKMPEEDQEEIEDLTELLDIDTPIENPGLVSKALDRSLDIAIDAYEDGEIAGKAANILFVGRAGTGKTSQIKQWAKARKVNLVMKDAKTFDKSDIGGGVAAMVWAWELPHVMGMAKKKKKKGYLRQSSSKLFSYFAQMQKSMGVPPIRALGKT